MQAVEEIPLAVAAERLGVSAEALRKRIARRTLTGRKHGVHWFVTVPTGPAGQTDVRPASGQQDASSGPDPRDALIEQLRAENTRVWGLVAELTRRLPELPAGPIGPTESQSPIGGTETRPMDRVHPSPETPATPTKPKGWLQRLLGR